MKRLFALGLLALSLAPGLAAGKTFVASDAIFMATFSIFDFGDSRPRDGGVESTLPGVAAPIPNDEVSSCRLTIRRASGDLPTLMGKARCARS